MAYPDGIINTLTDEYKLSEWQKRDLHETLSDAIVRSSVESGAFSPKQCVLRIRLSDENHAYVLSPVAAEFAISDTEALPGLKKHFESNPEKALDWFKIKEMFSELRQLPRRATRLKKGKVEENAGTLFDIALFLADNSVTRKEYQSFSPLIRQYMNALVLPIQKLAERYFSGKFEKQGRVIQNIQFSPKKGGVQLGVTMNITYLEPGEIEGDEKKAMSGIGGGLTGHRITYYIKTHQYGSTSQASSVKPVDAKELFIYKLLEFTGYGPKSYFFFNPLSEGGFYIATQDLAYTRLSGKEKHFRLFDKLKADLNLNPGAPEYEVERKDLIGLDMLTRILRLADSTTNPGNFGRVTVVRHGGETTKWKLLDFDARLNPEYYYSSLAFQGFLDGNGVYNYDYADFMRYIFKNPEYQLQRMCHARSVLMELFNGRPCQSREGNKMTFGAGVVVAKQFVETYMRENSPIIKVDFQASMEDLNLYIAAIHKNLEGLNKGISDRYDEIVADQDSDLRKPVRQSYV